MKKDLSPRRVDLRQATLIVNSSVSEWSARGIDAEVIIRHLDTSPQDREAVGLRLHCGRGYGRIMAYSGGWVDFEFSVHSVDDGETLLEIHPISDEGASAVVETLIERLMSLCDELSVHSSA